MYQPGISPNPFPETERIFEIRFSFPRRRDEEDLEALNQLLGSLYVSHVELHVTQGYIAHPTFHKPDGKGGVAITDLGYHAGVSEGLLLCQVKRGKPCSIHCIDEQVLQNPLPDEKSIIADWEKLHPGREVTSLNLRPGNCGRWGCFIIHREKPFGHFC